MKVLLAPSGAAHHQPIEKYQMSRKEYVNCFAHGVMVIASPLPRDSTMSKSHILMAQSVVPTATKFPVILKSRESNRIK